MIDRVLRPGQLGHSGSFHTFLSNEAVDKVKHSNGCDRCGFPCLAVPASSSGSCDFREPSLDGFLILVTMVHGGDLDGKGHCESSLYGVVS